MKGAKDTADRQPEADKKGKKCSMEAWMRTAGEEIVVVCLPFVLVFVVEGIITRFIMWKGFSEGNVFAAVSADSALCKEYGG